MRKGFYEFHSERSVKTNIFPVAKLHIKNYI